MHVNRIHHARQHAIAIFLLAVMLVHATLIVLMAVMDRASIHCVPVLALQHFQQQPQKQPQQQQPRQQQKQQPQQNCLTMTT